MIYLDHAATAFPKPEPVVQAVAECLRDVAGSPARGGHAGTLAANRLVLAARMRAATLLGVTDAARIVLTSGATEALNLALRGTLRAGDHVVVSDSEHHAVARPLAWLERHGVAVSRVSHAAAADELVASLAAARRPSTRAVVLVHASNVTGHAAPLEHVARWCADAGLALGVDAAQSAGWLPLAVDAWRIAWLAASGHKGLAGPAGVGVLALGDGVVPEPLVRGGTGASSSSDDPPPSVPDGLEAGTRNLPGIAGLAAGIEHVLAVGVHVRTRAALDRAHQLAAGLDALGPAVERFGPGAVPIVSFRIRGLDPAEVADVLDQEHGIGVRAGLHCAPAAHHALGTLPAGTVRASPGPETTPDEIDVLLAALARLVAVAGGHAA